MSKKTWADVGKGDVLELGGREWVVAKMKAKGRKAKVVVERKGRSAESIVKLAERVTIVARAKDRDPLRDNRGAQRRWAKPTEQTFAGATPAAGLNPGNPKKTEPPAPATGNPWGVPVGTAEKAIGKVFVGAHLVAETGDEKKGYYVPPVDIMTVAAHFALFHGGIPDAIADDEAKMLIAHKVQHDAALRGVALAVNHWHTEKRPDLTS